MNIFLINTIESIFRCNKEWCGYLKDPDNYQYKCLPSQKPLQNLELKKSLETILEVYAEKSEQLAPCGSSQLNESTNHMVITKAPKSRFYGPESLTLRVSNAVSEKNNGSIYLVEQNRKACLSPGKLLKTSCRRRPF